MRPIYLIPGWGMPPQCMQKLQQAIQECQPKREVVIGSLPGYEGENTETIENQSDLQSSIARVLSHLFEQAPDQAIWCGWSFGATLALLAALDSPDQLNPLILLSPTPCFTERKNWQHGVAQKTFDSLFRIMERNFSKGWMQFLRLQYDIEKQNEKEQLQTFASQHKYFEPSLDKLRIGMQILCEVDLRKRLTNQPILAHVIGGQKDQVIPIEASRWLANQWGATINELDAGHAYPLTHSADVANIILNHLELT